jgi:cell division protease FtsH
MNKLYSKFNQVNSKKQTQATPGAGPEMKNKNPKLKKAIIGVWVFSAFLWFLILSTPANIGEKVSYNSGIASINNKEVAKAEVDDHKRQINLTLNKDDKFVYFSYPEGSIKDILDSLINNNIEAEIKPVPRPTFFSSLISALLPIFLLVGLLLYFSRKAVGASGIGMIGKLSRKKSEPVTTPKTTFKDVAGLDETVEELREVVEILSNPEKYRKLGGEVPRGFLLVGPPGTGKTLLAKAVAGEAGVPFFALSGSDFTEMFVGVGASRVRELFANARAQSPSIIFVDEIDSIARKRGNAIMGGNDERENTLNQLLAELDGFEGRNVIFLGATNRVDVLDPALLRPGRFDRKVSVPLPDKSGREAILKVHAKGKPFEKNIDFQSFAKMTTGLSGADLAYIINESCLDAARKGQKSVTNDNLHSSLAISILGRERKGTIVSQRDREIVAYHESGHTLAALLYPNADKPVNVSIIPRGGAAGVTWMGGDVNGFITRDQMFAKLVVAMSGRSAEEIHLDGNYTQGAHGDLQAATSIATEMITRYGMGEDLVSIDYIPGSTGSDKINLESSLLIKSALIESRKLLLKNKKFLILIANELLSKETLDAEQLDKLLQKHTKKK